MMSFHYPSFRIDEIAKASKVVREGQALSFRDFGQRGKILEVDLDLKSDALMDLRLRISAGRFDEPTTYEAALILADQRVRGIGYSATRTGYFFRARIPQGWHENVIDPNLPTREPDRNRHEPLRDFTVTYLEDFLRQVCQRWHIESPSLEVLL